MFMAWIAWGAACLTSFEPQLDQRQVEMRDHEIDAFDALFALERRDLGALRDAGRRLSRQDDVPDLPEHALPLLQSVRKEGQTIARIQGLDDAAAPLARMAGHCGSCHQLMEISPEAPHRELATEEAFFAVAFHDEARWRRAAEPLGSLGAASASTWVDRRDVLMRALAQLTLGSPP